MQYFLRSSFHDKRSFCVCQLIQTNYLGYVEKGHKCLRKTIRLLILLVSFLSMSRTIDCFDGYACNKVLKMHTPFILRGENFVLWKIVTALFFMVPLIKQHFYMFAGFNFEKKGGYSKIKTLGKYIRYIVYMYLLI